MSGLRLQDIEIPVLYEADVAVIGGDSAGSDLTGV